VSAGRPLFYQTTVGKKVIVAVTGLVLFGFVVMHLLGNLQIFEGPEKINAYGRLLRFEMPLLWTARIILLACLILHFVCTVQLAIRNRASRPVGYAMHEPIQAGAPSRFMIWSGVFLLFYIVYHVMHLTLGFHPHFNPEDIYANVVIGFQQTPVAIIYLLAMIALGFHLHHGIHSLFQTLGLTHPKYNPWRKGLATGLAWVIPLGYSLIPAAVIFGYLRLP
jgi:succinate dehydrogenase / fumarate reductase cytochrome b subunit